MPRPTYSGSPLIAEAAKDIGELLSRGERHAALRRAMAAADLLLTAPSDALRFDLRANLFARFENMGVSYQDKDFECVDYEQYELAADLPMVRGPAMSAAAFEQGAFFCTIGAAQTFGRLARRPWPTLLGEAVGLPVLNLSRAGAGPAFFLEPRLIRLARRARFVVLQVMSGRSVGCEEYPGEVMVKRDGKPTGLHRLQLLETLWKEDPAKALHYVNIWNRNYLALYRNLREAIDRPILLLWISDRQPRQWNPGKLLRKLRAGSFPHLIGQELYGELASLFDENIKHLTGPLCERSVSRITGEPCPYFGDGGKKLHIEQVYYPTRANHAQIAEQLIPWASAA